MNTSEIKKVAVLGSGTMGQGIALVVATAGFPTLLYDVQPSALTRAMEKLRERTLLAVAKGKLTPEQQQGIMALIMPVDTADKVKADLIIEAVVEQLEVKQKLFREIEIVNDGSAILATNTSSLSVASIADALEHPERFLGIHFFNPADVMRLVEVIAAPRSSPSIVKASTEFLIATGKVVVQSADSPGFIVNRVARHFYLEALKALEEEAAPIEGIDALLRATGFKMGPFELMDLIGIDINYAVSQSVYAAFANAPRFKPSSLQEEKVAEGKLGRKTGEGFYHYP